MPGFVEALFPQNIESIRVGAGGRGVPLRIGAGGCGVPFQIDAGGRGVPFRIGARGRGVPFRIGAGCCGVPFRIDVLAKQQILTVPIQRDSVAAAAPFAQISALQSF